MFNPAHPGEVLRDLYLTPSMSASDCRNALGVSRKHVSEIVNGMLRCRRMAVRLAAAFGGASSLGESPAQYDLWEATQRRRPK
jgi:addiction module HigA family antidote